MRSRIVIAATVLAIAGAALNSASLAAQSKDSKSAPATVEPAQNFALLKAVKAVAMSAKKNPSDSTA